MMGQSEAVYWHGLFLVGFCCMGLIAAATAITFAIPFAGYPVFVKSNPFLVFLLLMVFSITTILLLILVSVLFNGREYGSLSMRLSTLMYSTYQSLRVPAFQLPWVLSCRSSCGSSASFSAPCGWTRRLRTTTLRSRLRSNYSLSSCHLAVATSLSNSSDSGS